MTNTPPPQVLIGRLAHVLRTAAIHAAGTNPQLEDEIDRAENLLDQLREALR